MIYSGEIYKKLMSFALSFNFALLVCTSEFFHQIILFLPFLRLMPKLIAQDVAFD